MTNEELNDLISNNHHKSWEIGGGLIKDIKSLQGVRSIMNEVRDERGFLLYSWVEDIHQGNTCEECDDNVGDDSLVKISTFDSKDDKLPSYVKWVCKCCANDLFGDDEPSSIFG